MSIFKRPRSMPREITTRWLIAAATCVALVSVIYIGKTPYGGQPQVGKVADRDVYAPVDFSFNAGVDTEKTEQFKKDAALSIKDIYDIDPAISENAALNVKALFGALKEAKASQNLGTEERLAKLKPANKLELSDNDLKALLSSPESEKIEPVVLSQL